MMDDDELKRLGAMLPPHPRAEAKARAVDAAMRSFDETNPRIAPQGSAGGLRLTHRAHKLWSGMMRMKLLTTPALAGLVALPIAGYATFYLMREAPFSPVAEQKVEGEPKIGDRSASPVVKLRKMSADADTSNRETIVSQRDEASPTPDMAPVAEQSLAAPARDAADVASPVAPAPSVVAPSGAARDVGAEGRARTMAAPRAIGQEADAFSSMVEDRERFAEFKTNPVRSALEDPVSTFSIDVDTASYSFVRRSLKQGVLPQADTVRVEEMVNYFPYDWKGPEAASTPFNSTVTVMPAPWNANTKLLHVAIQGYDVKPAEQPKANLVFLIDVSGSMDEPDKLPLLRSAFRLLVSRLQPEDTVSIVTYAGDAGTVLMPTKASDRATILAAIDNLRPGGSTAGAAGIEEAYRLAEKSFVKDGVNRVMLATDGDFNVGQTDDDELRRLIEAKRKSGVFLSVFGFGRGNLNDQMMQTLAQNGNGSAAYIDTLAEAEKVLVQDASATLFPIAKDVKIQVEFNPAAVAEYRLIGYETRALNREDFNNDKVDAGEIGSGHSVTAIYELTPKGSAAAVIDDLRYGQAQSNNPAGIANADEYAFVKIRYKLPNEDV